MGEHDRTDGGVGGTGAGSADGQVTGTQSQETDVPVWDDEQWLLGFVAARHMPCPRCGYDLRNLTTPQCPECGERLALRVGAATPRFGLLVLAMAPGLFSSVCTVLLAVPLFAFRHAKGAGPPTALYIAEVFGLLSGAFVIGLYKWRKKFLAFSRRAQIACVAALWGLHILALVGLLATIP